MEPHPYKVGDLVHLKSNPETAMVVQELAQEQGQPASDDAAEIPGRPLVRVIWLDADLRPTGIVVLPEMLEAH